MQTVPCPDKPKVDPRVLRTRKLLEDAFRALVCERDYADISVGDITDRATVNRATFYSHFEDKSDLATSAMRSDFETALRAKISLPAPLTEENLIEVGTVIFDVLAGLRLRCPKAAEHLKVTGGLTLQATLYQFLSYWIKGDRRSAKLFPDAQPETVASVLAWALYGSAINWRKQDGAPEEVVSRIIHFAARR